MRIGSFQADEYGELQRLVDSLYSNKHEIDRLDQELTKLLEARIVTLLPPGIYERSRLCDQLNSSLAAHGWGSLYGTVE